MNRSATAAAFAPRPEIIATDVRVRDGISYHRAGVIALEKGARSAEVFRQGGVHLTVAITGTFAEIQRVRRALGN